jgi:hypothetical protein
MHSMINPIWTRLKIQIKQPRKCVARDLRVRAVRECLFRFGTDCHTTCGMFVSCFHSFVGCWVCFGHTLLLPQLLLRCRCRLLCILEETTGSSASHPNSHSGISCTRTHFVGLVVDSNIDISLRVLCLYQNTLDGA